MRFAVLGAGALGSVLAGTLAREHDVALVGHESPHLDAVGRNGLRVERPDGSVETHSIEASTDHSQVAGADVLVIAVKAYDTGTAMQDVEGSLSESDVLTLQNGLGNLETIAEYVPRGRVIGGSTTIGAYVAEPGLVRHTGWGRTAIGRPWDGNDQTVESVATSFRDVGFETSVEPDIHREIWQKVLVNVGINPITALTRRPNGELLDGGPGQRLLEAAVAEAHRVAAAEGHEFDEDPLARTESVARETGPNRSSMLQDITQGSRTEIEALNGAVVERAADHGIDVPVNRTLVDLVRLLEGRGEADMSSGDDL